MSSRWNNFGLSLKLRFNLETNEWRESKCISVSLVENLFLAFLKENCYPQTGESAIDTDAVMTQNQKPIKVHFKVPGDI